jgi:hypothetical protein
LDERAVAGRIHTANRTQALPVASNGIAKCLVPNGERSVAENDLAVHPLAVTPDDFDEVQWERPVDVGGGFFLYYPTCKQQHAAQRDADAGMGGMLPSLRRTPMMTLH